MQHVEAFAIFAKVGELGSISGAARALGLPKANVSRSVAKLEQAYKISLIDRTTRKVRLTEIGRAFHIRCLRVLDEMAQAEAELSAHRRHPAGVLRVGCSSDVAVILLADNVGEFLARYPDIDLRMHVGERLLPEPETLDLVLHSGWLTDSRLIARKISAVKTMLVASRSYVDRHGLPKTVDDLQRHSIIGNFYHDRATLEIGRLPAHVPILEISSGADRYTVPIWRRFTSTSQKVILEIVRHGIAIAPIAAISIRDELADGSLIRVLPSYEIHNPANLYALYTERAAMAPKLQVFLDFVLEIITRDRPD